MPDPIRSNPLPAQSPVNGDPPPEGKTPPAPPPGDTLSAAARQLAGKYSVGASNSPGREVPDRLGDWDRNKFKAESACLLLPCDLALFAAELEMPKGGVARKTMDHFLSGSAAPLHVDLNAELARNPQLRVFIASRIEAEIAERAAAGVRPTEMSGAIWVPQTAYGESVAGKDQLLSLGGTFFEYQVAGSAADGSLEVRLNVADNYFWSPNEPRATQCLHECGSSLVAAKKAVEFSQVGEGTLFVNEPWCNDPGALLNAQNKVEHRDNGRQ